MVTKSDGIQEEEMSKMEQGVTTPTNPRPSSSITDVKSFCASAAVVTLAQKLIAEVIGTFFVIFAGCGSVVVNNIYEKVTFPGVCVTWGLIVMVMVYSVGHISGAHFNPAVTITFAVFRRFPYREVPAYIVAQLIGSIMASGALVLMFDVTPKAYFGTVPVGSDGQSFVLEIFISFLLMFVISGVSTDSRAIGELAGIAVGMTILLNVFLAGYAILLAEIASFRGFDESGKESIGPAIVKNVYKGLWVYIVGPIIGTLAGGLAYNLIRSTEKPLRELTRSGSFLKTIAGDQ